MEINQLKKLAAERAVDEIRSGMIIGLGTGTTFQYALEKFAQKIRNNELKNIIAVPSSLQTEKEALRLGIPIATLNEVIKRETGNGKRKTEIRNQKSAFRIKYPADTNSPFSTLPAGRQVLNSQLLIDLTIDGADEIDEHLNLIKGGGGALLHEKMLAQASKKFVVIVDESKLSKYLGTNFSVPVEVIKSAVNTEKLYLESLGAKVSTRKNSNGTNYITDENNFIIDANFGEIKNPEELSALLDQRAGIVEHGLFIGMTSKLYCAMNDGTIRIQNAEC